MTITIGRTNGPSTDRNATSIFEEKDLPLIKDVVAMVNAVSSNKEKWYIYIDNDEYLISIPVIK